MSTLKHRIPEGTFLRMYIEFMENYETARRFDVFSGLWVLSSVLGRHVVVDRPGSNLPINLFTLLVADSGIARKSTAVNHAQRLLEMYYSRVDDPGLFITARATPKAVALSLAKQCDDYDRCTVHFVCGELVNLLGRGTGAKGVPSLLTELYDCPQRATGLANLEDGVRDLQDVYATFLGACAPSWLVRAINPDVLEGGFASRVLIIFEKRGKGKYPWLTKDVNITQMYRQGVDELCDLVATSHRYPQIQLTDGAIKKYSNWYKNAPEANGIYTKSFSARKHDHVLKIAALLSINKRAFTIDAMDISIALQLVNQCEEDGQTAFAGALIDVGKKDILLDNLSKLQRHFIARGGNWTTQTMLALMFNKRLSTKALHNILDLMLREKLVQHVVERTGKAGPPKRLWRGTTLLVNTDMSEFAVQIDKSRAA